MAIDMSRSPSRGKKNNEICEIDEAAEARRERRLELWGMAVIVGIVIYLLSLKSKLGIVGVAIYYVSITLLGKVGAYVIPLGLVLLAASLFLARRNKNVDGLWKFFLILAPVTSCIVDILLHTRTVYLEASAKMEVGLLGIYLSRFFRNAFGTVGSLWLIAALVFLLFFALTGISIFGTIKGMRGAIAGWREKAKVRALAKAVQVAAEAEEEVDEEREVGKVIVAGQREDKSEEKSQLNLFKGDSEEASGEDDEDAPKPKKKKKRRRRKYKLPPLNLLRPSPKQINGDKEQAEAAACVIRTLETYGVQAELLDIIRGPRVTRVEVGISEGTRLYKVEALSEEIAYALPAKAVRIEAPIPDKRAVGIEFPNRTPVIVTLREMLADEKWKKHPSPLYMAIAKDLGSESLYADLCSMPHLLIAGATGTGKSVCLNACIISLLYRTKPDELRMILIDPKGVEMAIYEGLPHLLAEVVNDIEDALNALRWAVEEMRGRFKKLKAAGVNNVAEYNEKIGAEEDPLPYIVIVIDEMADLMAAEPVEMERVIAALTRLARAVGIHLVLATQRPDVKVITGGIKANIPARIAFKLPAPQDSRTVLNNKGADKLLGKGDMLYQGVEEMKPIRAQGALVTGGEMKRVVKFWVDQGEPEYDDEVLKNRDPVSNRAQSNGSQSVQNISIQDQELLDKAIRIIWTEGEASASLLQRKLGIGWPKAGRFMGFLEEMRLVGPKAGTKPRSISFDENHPALKLFEDEDYANVNVKAAATEDKKKSSGEDDDFIPPVDSLDGDRAAGEISGI